MGQKETRKIVVLGCVYLLKCQNGMVYFVYGKRTQHRTENGGYHRSGKGLLYPFDFPHDGRS
jgi:predicted GIY-YIG superfamily endonuclease